MIFRLHAFGSSFLARIFDFWVPSLMRPIKSLDKGELKSRRGDVITIIQSFSGDSSDSKKHKKHEDDS